MTGDKIGEIGDEIAAAITTAHIESSGPGNPSPTGDVDTDSAIDAITTRNVDVHGTRFDPAVHRARVDNGEPIKTKSGAFAKKPGTKKPIILPQTEPAADAVSDQPAEQTNYKQVADGLVRTIEAVPVSIMGQHWALSSAERRGFAPHVEKICADSGIDDMPPWIALTILGLAYTSSRLAMPETAERVEQIKRGLLTRGISAGYKYVKSWFNPRSERLRENDIGAAAVATG